MNKYSSNLINEIQEHLPSSNQALRENEPYIDLWVSVIKQAFDDLKYHNSKRSDLRLAFRGSVNFFKESNLQFIYTCNTQILTLK